MSIRDEHRWWLALRLTPEVTRARFYTLMERFDTPEEVFGASAGEIASLRGFDHKLARAVLEAPRTASLTREIELISRHGVRLLTPSDPDYPDNFRRCTYPPPFLYVRGSFSPNDRYSISLVGSRNSTVYGRGVSQQFATRFASFGLTVVSGFARGIDAAAHQGALAAGGRTIAVLGNGLAVCYPAEHRALGERIVQSGGALVSEYSMETSPDRYNFPERNRLIATLSLGTLVVEAAERSGSLITAREALEENRFVFAVPGDITRNNSRGTNALIQAGARLVQRAEDALSEMRHLLRGYLQEEVFEEPREEAGTAAGSKAAKSSAGSGRKGRPLSSEASNPADSAPTNRPLVQPGRPAPSLTPEETQIYNLIRHEPQYLDSLAAQLDTAQFPVSRLSAILLSLELKSAVRQLPGRLYAVLE